MARPEFGLGFGICVVLAVGGYGCGSKSAFKEPPPASSQLAAIGRAYLDATMALERGPLSKDELKPYLHKDLADKDVFRSPNDNEEFVIHWGVDTRDLNLSGHPRSLPVLAYEKHGKDGKRLVLLGGRYVNIVEDNDLADLVFPPGFRAPR